MRRKPTEKLLRRWLETGKPAWVGNAAGSDPSIAARLDAMSALATAEVDALAQLVRPRPRFEERALEGVRTRMDNYGTASLLAEMVGLGFHVGRALLPATDEDSSSDGSSDTET